MTESREKLTRKHVGGVVVQVLGTYWQKIYAGRAVSLPDGVTGDNLLVSLVGLEQRKCSAIRIDLTGGGIGDSGTRALAAVLCCGALPALQDLGLGRNHITCAGLRALTAVCAEGAPAQLTRLSLEANDIGDDGLVALAWALKDGGGSLARLHALRLQVWGPHPRRPLRPVRAPPRRPA